ncbi:MAG: hypothetical protein JW749_09250 [Sedimentisphaerales bacterium]|nr:hypothetical protein [Sedimentisphaerales bacterium]
MSKLNYLVSTILTAVLCFSGNLPAYSGDGDGSPENPYQISTVEDWQELMATPDDWSSSFILAADVNLAGVTLTPVGNESTPFTGVFDGNDNIISNAVINQPGSDYIGLFGYVGAGCQIRNLGVEVVNMTGSNYVGGLVGSNGYWSNSGGNIASCYVTGLVSGNGVAAGGMVGFNVSGTLTDCYTTGSVSGGSGVGGMVGETYGSTLTDCFATGSVTGYFAVGGLMGNNDGTLTDCFATGSVTGYFAVGGLMGNNDGTLTDCFATGSVSGNDNAYVGGLVGYNDGTLTDCFATGSVTGNYNVGGLVGTNGGTLTACYATGSVSGTTDVGGLVAENNGSLTDCFWDIQTSGLTYSSGGTGKTTAEMKTLCTFTSAGWNFVEIWGIGENQTYPYLRPGPAGDLNYDKKVDFADFAILASHWLEEI